MDWTELTIQIPIADLETATAIAQMTVPYGVYIEDYSDMEQQVHEMAHVDLIDEELLRRDRDHALIHIYISPDENPAEALSFLQQQLTACSIPHQLMRENVREEDWATAWRQYYKPVRVGQKLMVVPSWEQYQAQEEDVVITLDPGMAFGTGTHATTRLCMRLIEQYLIPGQDMLDVGTGSGILAVTALKLGARKAVGVDIDATAVRVAGENAALNGVEDNLSVICGDLACDVKGSFQLITANIVADIIIRLTPDVPPLLKEGGTFVVSGIIDSREQDVRDALQANGFHVISSLTEGGWVALACQRK
ncbi:50S ribosomal protein L11 methyltransferase [Solibaculum mannosilyticum]|uniref:Ribosomal protein L11 methyltransferase n=1 Tax=Solibaculum mannosilyticum TaxID=2780922 RepID=A0A7I8D7S6_9FIRM|nr:50S ribosomal protein L11 methyltransferase [Solibaculum mannosilyticum]BCI61539.1 ribosomal protein L11 methyltransferase [Solibaculum mannosilyticum]